MLQGVTPAYKGLTPSGKMHACCFAALKVNLYFSTFFRAYNKLAVSLKNKITLRQMIFWYTTRGTYDKNYDNNGMSWDKYIEWSKLTHLTELVSLDVTLNEILVETDNDNADDWKYIVIVDQYQTGFFTTLDYVLQKTKSKDLFNLLTVVLEPDQDCKNIKLQDFDFIGYELLDHDIGTSALTNCGGFDETFLPNDLNNYGLIDDYEKAYDIKKRLFENNPDEYHADTNVIAVWRHKTIGRQK
jgi:hypothetical protein